MGAIQGAVNNILGAGAGAAVGLAGKKIMKSAGDNLGEAMKSVEASHRAELALKDQVKSLEINAEGYRNRIEQLTAQRNKLIEMGGELEGKYGDALKELHKNEEKEAKSKIAALLYERGNK